MASLVMLSAALLLGLFLPSSMANNVLFGGDRLNTGESLREGNFKFTMMSDDCTLVLNDNDQTVWSSPTNGLGNNCFAQLQNNGNLVIRNDMTRLFGRATPPARRTTTSSSCRTTAASSSSAALYGPSPPVPTPPLPKAP
ncbi:mannose-specific lectin-like [Zingiber officinale]|uniref:mannose-specific lectin-like n=1 Tax=Zingiber officinale TaxID=94328 RepID=UPI001C4A99EA|nr:mannose-specific lectin-like [Zingiber officinale]